MPLVQTIKVTNPAESELNGREIIFQFGAGPQITLTSGWSTSGIVNTQNNLQSAIDSTLGGGTCSVTSEESGGFWFFTFTFISPVGYFNLPLPYDINNGLGGEFFWVRTVVGNDPDEYGIGGNEEVWEAYRLGSWLNGTFYVNINGIGNIGPYNWNDLYSSIDSTFFSGSGFQARCVSGDGSILSPWVFQWTSESTISPQPILSIVNIDSVIAYIDIVSTSKDLLISSAT